MMFRLTWIAALLGPLTVVRSLDAQSVRRDAHQPSSQAISVGLPRVDSTMRETRREILVDAAVGGVTGAAVAYGLARVAHRAFCEGTAQCAEYPRRAVQSSVIGGAFAGAVLGAAIGWIILSAKS